MGKEDEKYWAKCSRCEEDVSLVLTESSVVGVKNECLKVLYYKSIKHPESKQNLIVCDDCKEEYNKLKDTYEQELNKEITNFLKRNEKK